MTGTWADLASLILIRLEWLSLAYLVIVNSLYAVLLLSASWAMLCHARQVRGENLWRVLGSKVAPRISMLAPAYNEAATIGESVRALLTLYYPNLEVVVVNDGSKDTTFAVLQEQFNLVPIHPIYRRQIHTKPVRGLYRSRRHPNLLVIDKDNGGKADALNTGLQLATGELVCAMDADTLIEPDALLRMIRPFFLSRDVLAAGGIIRVVNNSTSQNGRAVVPHAPRHALVGFQVVEYLRAFLNNRLAWSRLGFMLCASGAFNIWRRDILEEVGGWSTAFSSEDIELTFRVHELMHRTGRPYRILFHPDGKSFFVTSWTDGTLGHYQADNGTLLATVRLASHPTDIVWRPGALDAEAGETPIAGRLFVSAANTNNVYSIGVTAGKELRVLPRSSDEIVRRDQTVARAGKAPVALETRSYEHLVRQVVSPEEGRNPVEEGPFRQRAARGRQEAEHGPLHAVREGNLRSLFVPRVGQPPAARLDLAKPTLVLAGQLVPNEGVELLYLIERGHCGGFAG